MSRKKIFQNIIGYLLIVALVVVAVPKFAAADEVKCDTTFYSTNNIRFFNPCVSVACGDNDSNPADGVITKLSGSNNEEKIMNYLKGEGLSPKQAAGITANLKAISGYSPFFQEAGQTWPKGGYGIAGFKGGQRVAVTDALKKDVKADTFSSYYVAAYGGAVSGDSGSVPVGVSEEVNDSFLVSELNYLFKYASDYVPSTDSSRVADLKTDHNFTIDSGTKLMAYIKTLDSEGDVSKAWLYLYEYPANRKDVYIERSVTATALVASASESDSSCGVGAGGFTFEQATHYAEIFHNEKKGYFLNDLHSSFWAEPGQVNQCTALVMYSINRYVAPLGNTDHGRGTAAMVAGSLPGFYEIVAQEDIRPFTVFSLSDGDAGHTGMIMGIEDDGSIILVEANTRAVANDGSPNFSVGQGLLESAHFGSKINAESDDPGIVTIEHWASVDAWLQAMAGGGWKLTSPVFAAPTDPSTILSKLEV